MDFNANLSELWKDHASSYVTIVTVASLVKLLSSNVFPTEAYLFDSLK